MIDYSQVDKTWDSKKEALNRELLSRASQISAAYKKDLTDEQFRKVKREEEFVSKIADFVNDCESLVVIHRAKISNLVYLIMELNEVNNEGAKEVFDKLLNDLRKHEKFLEENGLYEQYLKTVTQ